jgi:hypothetical protein
VPFPRRRSGARRGARRTGRLAARAPRHAWRRPRHATHGVRIADVCGLDAIRTMVTARSGCRPPPSRLELRSGLTRQPVARRVPPSG